MTLSPLDQFVRLLAVVGALSSVVLVATGCGADPSAAASGASQHVGTYEAVGEGGDSALLEGSVVIEQGCFTVETSDGRRILPFFPQNEVEWEGNALRYGGRDYRDGDPISLGGGSGGSGAGEAGPEACEGLRIDGKWTVAQDG